MKKTDVYVVVDTPKKAKKLKRLLDMFGEKHFADCHDFDFEDCVGEVVHFWGDEYFTYCSEINIISKTKVSIKELRNILAKEHLKEGDVVFMRSFRGEYESVLKIKCVEGEYLKVDKQLFVKGSNSIYTDGQDLIRDFIRYATEEEKALLEPKKKLEVGKWYISQLDKNLLVYIVDKENMFGISKFNTWFDNMECFGNLENYGYIEATPQEVEQALIEEAKRRYKVGDKLSKVDDDYSKGDRIFSLNLSHQSGLCDLWIDNDGDRGHSSCIFKNGQWATITEQDKFAELKEAHSKGAKIQFRHSNGEWVDINHQYPTWQKSEYRIKPSEIFTDHDIAIVERLHDTLLDNHGYSLESKLLTDARMLANKIKSNIK